MRLLQPCLKDQWYFLDDRFQVSWPPLCREYILWWARVTQLREGVSFSLPVPDVSCLSDALDVGWGGPHRRTPRLGPLVSSSEDSLHQPERASSSSVRPVGLRTPVGGPVGSSVLQQHHHSSVCPSPAAIHHGLVQCHSGRSQSPHMVIWSEWTLHQQVVDKLVHKWPAVIRLFATSLTARLPVYLSPASDSRVAGTDALLQLWDDLQAYAFPPIAVIRRVLVN